MSFELESLNDRAFNTVYRDLLESLSEFLQSDNKDMLDVEISAVEEGNHAIDEEDVREEPEGNLAKKPKLENPSALPLSPSNRPENNLSIPREQPLTSI